MRERFASGSLIAALLVSPFAQGCRESEAPRPSADPELALLDDLYSVAVPDGERAIAVGDHGAIYRTGDGGRRWRRVDSPTSRSLYAVSMADAGVGWAVGQYGTILRTVDGGESWAIQTPPERKRDHHLLGVHAVDASTAWAVGVWGTRILTRDGGATWSDHSVPVTPDHPLFAWLSEAEQQTIRDGGSVDEDVVLNDVYCRPRPSESCWIVGEFGTIFRSEDLGRTWIRASVTRSAESEVRAGVGAAEAPYLFAVRFDSERAGLIAGVGGAVLRSVDAGRQWSRVQACPEGALFSIARAADRHVAVGEKGLVRFSLDGGRRWDSPASGALPALFSFLRDVDFDEAGDVGYIVGRGGLILRSGDSGRSWTAVLREAAMSRALLPTEPTRLKGPAPGADSSRRGRAR